MKVYRSSSKSGLFLIELIIAIVFFAVASAICIQLFVKAHLISARSGDLSAANAIVQSEAEYFKTHAAQVVDASGGGAYAVALYNAQGEKRNSEEGAVYRLAGEFGWQEGLYTATYTVYKLADDGEPVLSLTVAAYEQ